MWSKCSSDCGQKRFNQCSNCSSKVAQKLLHSGTLLPLFCPTWLHHWNNTNIISLEQSTVRMFHILLKVWSQLWAYWSQIFFPILVWLIFRKKSYYITQYIYNLCRSYCDPMWSNCHSVILYRDWATSWLLNMYEVPFWLKLRSKCVLLIVVQMLFNCYPSMVKLYFILGPNCGPIMKKTVF